MLQESEEYQLEDDIALLNVNNQDQHTVGRSRRSKHKLKFNSEMECQAPKKKQSLSYFGQCSQFSRFFVKEYESENYYLKSNDSISLILQNCDIKLTQIPRNQPPFMYYHSPKKWERTLGHFLNPIQYVIKEPDGVDISPYTKRVILLNRKKNSYSCEVDFNLPDNFSFDTLHIACSMECRLYSLIEDKHKYFNESYKVGLNLKKLTIHSFKNSPQFIENKFRFPDENQGEDIFPKKSSYVGIYLKSLKIQTFSINVDQAYVDIRNLIFDSAQYANLLKPVVNIQSKKGEVLIESKNDFEIEWDSHNENVCLIAQSINRINNKGCDMKFWNTAKGPVLFNDDTTNKCFLKVKLCDTGSCEGQYPKVQVQITQDGSFHATRINDKNLKIKDLNRYYGKYFDDGPKASLKLLKAINSFKEKREKHIGAQATGVVTLGDQYLYDDITQKWTIALPSYAQIKPWTIAVLSGTFLGSNATHIRGHLNPGFCPNNRHKNRSELNQIQKMLETYNNDNGSIVSFIVGRYQQRPWNLRKNQTLENLNNRWYYGLGGSEKDLWIKFSDSSGRITEEIIQINNDVWILTAILLSFMVSFLIIFIILLMLRKIVKISENHINQKKNHLYSYSKIHNLKAEDKEVLDMKYPVYLYLEYWFSKIIKGVTRKENFEIERFFFYLFRKKKVDDNLVNKNQVKMSDVLNLYQKFCFLLDCKPRNLVSPKYSDLLKKKGYSIRDDDQNNRVMCNIQFKKSQKITSVNPIDSLRSFINYNVKIIPPEINLKKKLTFGEFQIKYQNFCRDHKVIPHNITEITLIQKYKIIFKNEKRQILYRSNISEEEEEGDKLQNQISLHYPDIKHLNDVLTSIIENRSVNIKFFEQSHWIYYVEDIFNLLLIFLINLAFFVIPITLQVILETHYADYAMARFDKLQTLQIFIFNFLNMFLVTILNKCLTTFQQEIINHFTQNLDSTLIIDCLRQIYQRFSCSQGSQKIPINFQLVFSLVKFPLWLYMIGYIKDKWNAYIEYFFKILHQIQWIIVQIQLAMVLWYLIIIVQWIMLGAIIFPMAFLPYASGIATYVLCVNHYYYQIKNLSLEIELQISRKYKKYVQDKMPSFIKNFKLGKLQSKVDILKNSQKYTRFVATVTALGIFKKQQVDQITSLQNNQILDNTNNNEDQHLYDSKKIINCFMCLKEQVICQILNKFKEYGLDNDLIELIKSSCKHDKSEQIKYLQINIKNKLKAINPDTKQPYPLDKLENCALKILLSFLYCQDSRISVDELISQFLMGCFVEKYEDSGELQELDGILKFTTIYGDEEEDELKRKKKNEKLLFCQILVQIIFCIYDIGYNIDDNEKMVQVKNQLKDYQKNMLLMLEKVQINNQTSDFIDLLKILLKKNLVKQRIILWYQQKGKKKDFQYEKFPKLLEKTISSFYINENVQNKDSNKIFEKITILCKRAQNSQRNSNKISTLFQRDQNLQEEDIQELIYIMLAQKNNLKYIDEIKDYILEKYIKIDSDQLDFNKHWFEVCQGLVQEKSQINEEYLTEITQKMKDKIIKQYNITPSMYTSFENILKGNIRQEEIDFILDHIKFKKKIILNCRDCKRIRYLAMIYNKQNSFFQLDKNLDLLFILLFCEKKKGFMKFKKKKNFMKFKSLILKFLGYEANINLPKNLKRFEKIMKWKEKSPKNFKKLQEFEFEDKKDKMDNWLKYFFISSIYIGKIDQAQLQKESSHVEEIFFRRVLGKNKKEKVLSLVLKLIVELKHKRVQLIEDNDYQEDKTYQNQVDQKYSLFKDLSYIFELPEDLFYLLFFLNPDVKKMPNKYKSKGFEDWKELLKEFKEKRSIQKQISQKFQNIIKLQSISLMIAKHCFIKQGGYLTCQNWGCQLSVSQELFCDLFSYTKLE